MQHLFTLTTIQNEDENEIEYLEFKYLQTLFKKINVNYKEIEMTKADSTLAKVYQNYLELKKKLQMAEDQLLNHNNDNNIHP